ncbi:MAG TPA: efflux RND transporter periplasmic adaptor subunit [Blastocatellia bacterium]|nr:efflux RND transporter periplasmic adaptor subunit [Blastocatellia bacterium]
MKLKFNKKQLIVTAIGVALVGGTGGYFLWGRRASSEEYITAKVERGAIRNTVSATGTLQAVTTVQVGSQVSGTIQELYADFNTVVKKGQVVAQLDPRVYEAQVASQRANLEQARANLADAEAKVLAADAAVETQRAGVSGANANLAALKAQRDDAQSLLRRQEGLAKAGVIPERDLEATRTSYNAAEARYNQAAAQLDQARVSERTSATSGLAQAKAQAKQARAQIQQIESSLKMAEVNLSYTTISSPIDGVVVSRNVDKGQTVAASLQAPTLFTIANDLTQMQVIANIDQADIGVINQSNRVSFTVDAFPGHNFGGTINQIRLSPQNVQNVITYNVVIDVKNPDLKLKPGMTANLTLTIAERQDALKIPNAALRFWPQGVPQEKRRELLHAGDTQARSGAGTEPGKDGAKVPAPNDAMAKDAGKNPGQSADRAAPPQAGNIERRGNQADGQQRGTDGGERRRAWRDGGGQSGSDGGGERRRLGGRGNQSDGQRADGQRADGQRADGQRADGQQGALGGGERRRWRGGGDGGDGAGGGARRDWKDRGNQANGQQGAPDGARPPGAGANAVGPGAAGGGGGRRDQAGRGSFFGADGASNRTMQSSTPFQEVRRGIVWVLGPDNKPQSRVVKLGITDGMATEVIESDLKEGDTIILAQNLPAEDRPQNNQQRPPGFGGMPGGGPRGPGGFGGGGGGGRR